MPELKLNNRKQIIYVVDDDVSVCRALKLLLELNGFRVETFTSAEKFLAFKHPKRPSCLVLDIRLPGGMSGFALQSAIIDRQLTMPIIFITSYGDIFMCVKAMQGGAVDFLPKPFSEKRMLNSIDQAIAKDKVQNKQRSQKARIEGYMKTLSPREMEVFRFVAQGMLNKQIASKRGTSIQTIKVHRSRVMYKMHAKTLTELIHLAQKAGITTSLN